MLDINFTNFITIALLSAISLAFLNWFALKTGVDIDLDEDDKEPLFQNFG